MAPSTILSPIRVARVARCNGAPIRWKDRFVVPATVQALHDGLNNTTFKLLIRSTQVGIQVGRPNLTRREEEKINYITHYAIETITSGSEHDYSQRTAMKYYHGGPNDGNLFLFFGGLIGALDADQRSAMGLCVAQLSIDITRIYTYRTHTRTNPILIYIFKFRIQPSFTIPDFEICELLEACNCKKRAHADAYGEKLERCFCSVYRCV